MPNQTSKPAPKAATAPIVAPTSNNHDAAMAGIQQAAEAWAAGLTSAPAGGEETPPAPPQDPVQEGAAAPVDDEDDAQDETFLFTLDERPLILGELVYFRSAQSDLSGVAKAIQEVPAMITQIHNAKTVDLTVFRPNGMTPIGVVNVQNHPAGKDSPFHTSWRRMTRDDIPSS